MNLDPHPVLASLHNFRKVLTEQIEGARLAQNWDLVAELWDNRNQLDLWLLDNDHNFK